MGANLEQGAIDAVIAGDEYGDATAEDRYAARTSRRILARKKGKQFVCGVGVQTGGKRDTIIIKVIAKLDTRK